MDQNNRVNHSAASSGGAPKKKPAKKGRAGRVVGRVFLVLFTLCVIGVLTMAIFFKIFMTYVNTSLLPSLEDYSSVDMTVRLSSKIYDRDGNLLRTLYSKENRELVDLEDIPQDMIDALVAIEDKRFYQHKGVDWEGTAAAFYKTFTSGSTRGGSTLTQQVVRDIFEDKDVTVKRKIREIFRSLKFEADLAAEYDEEYAKNYVLEYYLNNMYFGQSCFGVRSAAKVYFGKDVSELDLAECACIIGITNNPSLYDPFYDKEYVQEDGSVKTPRDFNKKRQETILSEMRDQGYITPEEYDQAKNEKLLFRDTPEYAALHGKETPAEDEGEEESAKKKNVYSWYEDAVIEDAIALVQETLGLSRKQASEKVYTGGLQIYTAMDPDLQDIVDDVYEHLPQRLEHYDDLASAKGTPMDSAITLMDPYTGEVLAMAGGVGEKQVDRALNLATSPRAVGSAIKPLSVYAPAIDAGIVGPGTPVQDYPYKINDPGTGGYPRNDNGYKYTGWTTVARGVQKSINAVACQVLLMNGVENAFAFMEDNLGFDLAGADMDVSPLGMGSLTTGVSTQQMAAAYSSFPNEGVYTYPRTILRITDNNGNIIVDNQPRQQVAMKESTAYFMNKMLRTVISGGTGGGAYFDGMTIAGKTGTTSSYCDRYFVGYTPYYCAAVWTGYSGGSEKMPTQYGNPAAKIWKLVMEPAHEGLENKSFFDKPSGVTTVQVCADCGLKPGPLCASDVRGSRVVSAEIPVGAEPEETCTCHVEVEICAEASNEETGYVLAGEHCPASSRSVIVISQSRELLEIPYTEPVTLPDGTVQTGEAIAADDSNYQLSYLRWKGTCTVHDENTPDEPVLPGDPGYQWPEGLGPDDPNPGEDPDDPGTEPPDEPEDGGGQPQDPAVPDLPDEPEEPKEPPVPNVG